jgi:MFS transporter, DHA1 family, inner membrane transport protein
MPIAVLALTFATFGICTSEYVIMGLLPEVAADLSVSIPEAGMLVSVYAMGVVVGAPVLAVITARWPRRPTLIGLCAVFLVGNLLCAIAPSYGLLMAARVVTALCHGTYFGIASVVATNLVAPGRRSQAIALVFMGVTLANMLGVPFGTALGQALGWRATFLGICAINLVAMLAQLLWIPRALPTGGASLGAEFRALMDRRVVLGLLLSMLSSVSLFTVFTYITPILREVTGVSPRGVTYVLLLFGVGLSIGSVIGGRLGDRSLMRSLGALMLLLTAILAMLHISLGVKVPAIGNLFVWSVIAFAICPMLQTLVIARASGAPNLASTFNQSAFNLGNAIGAWFGGALLDRGVTLDDLPFASTGVAALACACVATLAWADRSAPRAKPAR